MVTSSNQQREKSILICEDLEILQVYTTDEILTRLYL